MNWVKIALCLLTGLYPSLTFGQTQFRIPPPKVITNRQGLPQAFVPAIVQDRQGFIWMATLDGLARYDGRQFAVFLPTVDGKRGLSSAGIEDLRTDPQGNLWIKSYQGDLDLFDTQRQTVVNFSRQPRYQRYVGRDTLDAYYPDRRRLWVWLRHKGLLCFDLTSPRVWRYRHQGGRVSSLSSDSVTSLVEDGRGTIWVATRAGLDWLDERTNSFVHYAYPPGKPSPDTPIRKLHRRQNGDLLLLSGRQLTLLDHRSHRMSQPLGLPRSPAQWWKNHLGTDSRGNDGRLPTFRENVSDYWTF